MSSVIASGRPGEILEEKSFSFKAVLLLAVIVPLISVPVAMWQLWKRVATWKDVVLLIGTYVPIALGVTVGFHRYFTHRSFDTTRAVKIVLGVLGLMSLEGTIKDWVADHIWHHKYSDEKGVDLHSPLDGLGHAHFVWTMIGRRADPAMFARHIVADSDLQLLDRLYPVLAVVSVFGLPFLLNRWRGVLWAGLVRVFLVHHVTWSINSICHTFGTRLFDTGPFDRSRNNPFVALLAMGEGWHNNHHAFPRSALHGLHGLQWLVDASHGVIWLMERVGFAWDVHRPTPEQKAAKLLKKRPAA